MDSAFIHQAANELVQNAGTRNIKQIARSCSLDISETSRIKDMLGLLSLYFDKPLILINRQLDKQTKQMVCGYALGHYLEHQLLMDLHTLDKFLTINYYSVSIEAEDSIEVHSPDLPFRKYSHFLSHHKPRNPQPRIYQS